MMKVQLDRWLGRYYPVSMATASILEQERFNIQQIPDTVFVNTRTFFRNYLSSVYHTQDYLNYMETNPQAKIDFWQEYVNDMMNFYNILQELSHGRVHVVYYYPTYENIQDILPYCKFREDSQKYIPSFKYIEQYTNHQVENPFDETQYIEIDYQLPERSGEVGILSHYAIDLLNSIRYLKLTLIESYTGRLKGRPEWYTKIKFGVSMRFKEAKYPFNKFMLQVFGDKANNIVGQGKLKERMTVREMALKDHWTPLTTNDKIRYSISKLKDKTIKENLLQYL